MQSLSRTEKGYLKPWFVKADDFRVVDLRKAAFAVTKKACWICGKPFREAKYAMVCSPESAALRVFKEPPCHPDCAEYAMQVCPFILYPNARRREANLPEEASLDAVNETLEITINGDNPGEYYLLVVNDFTFHQDRQVMTCAREAVIEIQYWVQGSKSPIPSRDRERISS